MVDLTIGARPDERFHLDRFEPVMSTFGVDWLCRRVHWVHATGGWTFTSWIVLWVFRWYHGTGKVDGTRTYAYRAGQYGQPVDVYAFVVTTTPKEMWSVRFSTHSPDRERVGNMGGI